MPGPERRRGGDRQGDAGTGRRAGASEGPRGSGRTSRTGPRIPEGLRAPAQRAGEHARAAPDRRAGFVSRGRLQRRDPQDRGSGRAAPGRDGEDAHLDRARPERSRSASTVGGPSDLARRADAPAEQRLLGRPGSAAAFRGVPGASGGPRGRPPAREHLRHARGLPRRHPAGAGRAGAEAAAFL